MKRVLIIQPYVPEYRRVFFNLLFETCQKKNIELTIYAPKPERKVRRKNDEVIDLPFVQGVSIFRIGIFSRRLDYYIHPRKVKNTDFDLIIMEQTLKNIQLPFLLLRNMGDTKIALWGHGKTIVKMKSRLEKWLQLALSMRADFFFSYTASGKEYLVSNGFQEKRIVALQNTNSSQERLFRIKEFEGRNLHSHNSEMFHCCFVGALEESKGLKALIATLPLIKASIPDFRFTFIGDGSDRELITELVRTSDYVEWWGHKKQEDLDSIYTNFSLILNPGRVGLVAVDSLMLQLPIVTMSNSLHAPEYEYIRDNGSSIAVDGNIPEYASKVIELLQNPKLIQEMREVCSRERDLYTVEKMVENFTSGLTCILSEGSDRV